MFVRSEWAELLVQTVIAAAVRHRDEKWMAVICDFYFKNHDKQRWESLELKALFAILPERLFNQFAIQELKNFEVVLERETPLVRLLELNESAWDKNLTLLLMKNVRYLISQNINYTYKYIHYRNCLDRAAYGSDASLYDVLNKSWSNEENYWTNWGKEIDDFLRVMKFRKEMIFVIEN